MDLAEEGYHVVLAHRVELDVTHDDHLVVVLVEHCVVDHLRDRGVIARCEELKRLRHALRCLEQAVAGGVLAYRYDDGGSGL